MEVATLDSICSTLQLRERGDRHIDSPALTVIYGLVGGRETKGTGISKDSLPYLHGAKRQDF